ncbi:MAG: hypothetical protein KDE26_10680 [Bacteroidetes bacterium]|nr:hypothetical protein [Bacteroidota bacterium]
MITYRILTIFFCLTFYIHLYGQIVPESSAKDKLTGIWEFNQDKAQTLTFSKDGTYEIDYDSRLKLGKDYKEEFDLNFRQQGKWNFDENEQTIRLYEILHLHGNDTIYVKGDYLLSIIKLTNSKLVIEHPPQKEIEIGIQKYKKQNHPKKYPPIPPPEVRTEPDIKPKLVKDIHFKNPIAPEEQFMNYAIDLFQTGNSPDLSILKDANRIFSGVCVRILPDSSEEKLRTAVTSFTFKKLKNAHLWGEEGICYKFYTRRAGYEDQELANAVSAYIVGDSIPKSNVYYLNLIAKFPSDEWKYLNFYPSDRISTVIIGKSGNTYLRQNGNFFVQITVYNTDEEQKSFGEYLYDVSMYVIDEEKGGAFHLMLRE